MHSLDYFHTMTRYNRWMNEKLYAVCAQMSDEERKRDLGAFFRSVHGTLNHILLADRLWMGRFLHRPFSVESLAQELYADFDELRRERKQTDSEIENWMATLQENDLAVPLTYKNHNFTSGQTVPLWNALLHFFNHQTHHRGQITTIMNQLGYDSGVTDLLYLLINEKPG